MSRHEGLRVLVIDDSAFSRRTLVRLLEASPQIDHVAWARDGEEALKKALTDPVDVITLDLEMPGMNGFTFLRVLMAECPTPVIVVSSRAGSEDVFQALELGAVDFVAKPAPGAAPELAQIERELLRKVHGVRELRKGRRAGSATAVRPGVTESAERGSREAARLVVIGASTGGPAALVELFRGLGPAPPCAFAVAQHMPEGFTRGFAARLGRLPGLEAREARSGDALVPGRVLVAPGGAHLEVDGAAGRLVARVEPLAAADRFAPSVDRLFGSAAKQCGDRVLAVLLTGMGDDGSRGAGRVREAGGCVLAESEESAVIFGMPRQAIEAGVVDAVLPLGRLAGAIHASIRSPRAALQGDPG